MKKTIAVIIRVYDRVEDLKYNLRIIRQTWTAFNYHIIVVSNGYPDGYKVDEGSLSLIDDFINLKENAGHKKGNSQLLIEGCKYIPQKCDYTIILEADTWLYTDNLIKKYVEVMDKNSEIVWSSADWYDKDYSLAVDFAIIKSSFILNNPRLFDFEVYPESYIANYLRDVNVKFQWITENMPVHVPAYVFKYPYVNDVANRRFYIFPKSRMITHHIEYLKNGMEQKKRYFNIVSEHDFFEEQKVPNKGWERFKMNFWINLSKLFLKRSWFKSKYYRELSD